MKRTNCFMIVGIVSALIVLSAVNTAFAGANTPLDGAHWRGPAVIADVILTDGVDELGRNSIIADYTATCSGQEVTGTEYYLGTIDDISVKSHLLYYIANTLNACRPDDVYGDLMVAHTISLDLTEQENGYVYARVILLYSVTK